MQYLKNKVYAHRPQNIFEVKLRIREEIASPSAYVALRDGKYTLKVRGVFAQGWRSP